MFFNEILEWLCDIPKGVKVSLEKNVRKERQSLDQRATDAAYHDLMKTKQLLVGKQQKGQN